MSGDALAICQARESGSTSPCYGISNPAAHASCMAEVSGLSAACNSISDTTARNLCVARTRQASGSCASRGNPDSRYLCQALSEGGPSRCYGILNLDTRSAWLPRQPETRVPATRSGVAAPRQCASRERNGRVETEQGPGRKVLSSVAPERSSEILTRSSAPSHGRPSDVSGGVTLSPLMRTRQVPDRTVARRAT